MFLFHEALGCFSGSGEGGHSELGRDVRRPGLSRELNAWEEDEDVILDSVSILGYCQYSLTLQHPSQLPAASTSIHVPEGLAFPLEPTGAATWQGKCRRDTMPGEQPSTRD